MYLGLPRLTKQEETYYKDFSLKTYTETKDGSLVMFRKYNKQGDIIHGIIGDYWYRQKWKNGYMIESKDNQGRFIKRRFSNYGKMLFEETEEGVTYDWTKK